MTTASSLTGQYDVEKAPDTPRSSQDNQTRLSAEEKCEQPSDVVASPKPERTIRGFRWFLLCIAIFSANLLYGLDTTISADIQGVVSETFDNVTQLGWLGIGFTLGSTVAILPLGKAYGVFNTKWLYLGCLTTFAAGSALCGAAPSMNALIVGRVWTGLGGAGMYLGYVTSPGSSLAVMAANYFNVRTLHLVTATSTPREAALYIGVIGLTYGGGCILGPIVGGLFADSAATWRWVGIAHFPSLEECGLKFTTRLFI
jgi:MFS family permease